MDTIVSTVLGAVRLGEPALAAGLTVIPVFGDLPAGPPYTTLGAALAAGTLRIAELESGASVPEVSATNSGSTAVLVLDGEELAGAKQNRIVNTTVLIGAGRSVVMPVSCTERGRWHHTSERFADSGNVALREVRAAQKVSVTRHARAYGSFDSDQHAVWAEVDALADRTDAESPTCSMRDMVEASRTSLGGLVASFPVELDQIGLLAVLGGEVLGMDLVSRPEAYAQLHERLVASYGFEALVGPVRHGEDDLKVAKEFVVSLADLNRTEHRSPGSGRSHRFSAPGVVGDALTYRNDIVHAAFFATSDDRPQTYRSGMARARDRRRSHGG